MASSDIKSSFKGSKGNADFFLDHLHSKLIKKISKYNGINAINYDADTGRGRIEFRVGGGEKAMKTKVVSRLTQEIKQAMNDSVNEKSERKIIRKINKMLVD